MMSKWELMSYAHFQKKRYEYATSSTNQVPIAVLSNDDSDPRLLEAKKRNTTEFF